MISSGEDNRVSPEQGVSGGGMPEMNTSSMTLNHCQVTHFTSYSMYS